MALKRNGVGNALYKTNTALKEMFKHTSVFSAELFSIERTLTWADINDLEDTVIPSDSKSAVT